MLFSQHLMSYHHFFLHVLSPKNTCRMINSNVLEIFEMFAYTFTFIIWKGIKYKSVRNNYIDVKNNSTQINTEIRFKKSSFSVAFSWQSWVTFSIYNKGVEMWNFFCLVIFKIFFRCVHIKNVTFEGFIDSSRPLEQI